MNDVTASKEAPPADAGKVYRRLLRYARPHWKAALVALAGAAVFAGTNWGFVKFLQTFLNDAFAAGARPPYLLWFVPVAIVVLFFLRGAGDYVANFFTGYVGRQIIKSLRGELFEKFLHLLFRCSRIIDQEFEFFDVWRPVGSSKGR